jgi:hypothetical protein
MSGTLSIRVKDEDLARVEAIASECSLSALSTAGHFMRAFRMAAGIRALRDAITNDMLKELMELQGSKLGFRTDKDREGGYKPDVVKDCAIEATLRGAYWIGNEFNIIANSCYLTKEYFIRVLREFPGLTDLRLSFAAPVMRDAEKKAWVACSASWKLHGVADHIEKRAYKIEGTEQMLDERIVVRLNAGMGEDAVLGKAERKLRAAIYSRITGTAVLEGEADDAENSSRPPMRRLADLTEQLEGKSDSQSSLEATTKLWDSWEREFESATRTTEVADIKSKLAAQAKTDEDRGELDRLAEATKERIRNARSQKELSGTK